MMRILFEIFVIVYHFITFILDASVSDTVTGMNIHLPGTSFQVNIDKPVSK
jgi:hypothetical protein